MTPREKSLAIAIGSILVLAAGGFGLRAFFLKPLQKIDKQTAVLKEKLEKINAERRAYFAAEDLVKKFAQRSFADDLGQASAKSGEMLTKEILLSGLKENDFSRLPVGPRKLRGAQEIGWSVQGQGKLSDVVNLIFLLQESPYLHRIENLAISAGEVPGQVRAGFRFLTLVMDPAPIVDRVALSNELALDSAERRTFDGIASRDLLRPYLKRSPDKSNPGSGTPLAPAGPASLQIVSLSEWMGRPEVHIRDLTNQKTLHFRPGDELAGGAIVMVDYRPLPLPGHAGLKSFSRVILRIGTEYWAVERGQTLADKHRMSVEELPEQLSKL
jgi:hypothetical protein